MLKLMKLEWKKHKIGRYIRNAVILFLILTLLLFSMCFFGIANDPVTGKVDSAPETFNVTSQVELLTNVSFLIFTAVMFSTFVVSTFKNKTVNLMFSYPIKRQKIVAAEMLSVWIFNGAALFLVKTAIYGILFAASQFMQSAFPVNYSMADGMFYLQIIMKTTVTVTVGFIALFIGRLLNSSKATIVSSFLLILLMNGTIGDFSLSGSALFPIILIIISLCCAGLSLLNVESKDVLA